MQYTTEYPVRGNRFFAEGVRAIPITDPLLLRQWHHSKNGSLTPDLTTPGSHKKVWWRCEKGHEWQAEIKSRTLLESGCPYCAGKVTVPGENDLATLRPDLARQWDQERNGTLTPDQVSPYSNRKVWWRCRLGHGWQTAVSARTWGSDCPYCAGRKAFPGFNDLATKDPLVAAEWDPGLNGNLTPQMVTVGSHKKVWWRCAQGHVWKAVMYSRTGPKRCGCPVCAGKVRQRGRGQQHVPTVKV